jgi:hypothetical protein
VLVLRDDGKGVTEASVSQTLRETLQPRTRYVLSVWAGQRINDAAFPWPRVTMALYAGTQRLKRVTIPEPKIAPHYGVWIENLLAYSSPAKPAPGRLRIVLERSGPSPAQACFDSVMLTARTG